jgi:hypothetical protein
MNQALVKAWLQPHPSSKTVPSSFKEEEDEEEGGEYEMEGSDSQNVSIQAAFDKYDVDESGFIDIMEFRSLLEDLGIVFSSKDADKMLHEAFRRVDKDMNGQVSFSEFSIWWRKDEVDLIVRRSEGLHASSLPSSLLSAPKETLLEQLADRAKSDRRMKLTSHRQDILALPSKRKVYIRGLTPNTCYHFRSRLVGLRSSSPLSKPLVLMTPPLPPPKLTLIRLTTPSSRDPSSMTMAEAASADWSQLSALMASSASNVRFDFAVAYPPHPSSGCNVHYRVEVRKVPKLSSSSEGRRMRRSGGKVREEEEDGEAGSSWEVGYEGPLSVWFSGTSSLNLSSVSSSLEGVEVRVRTVGITGELSEPSEILFVPCSRKEKTKRTKKRKSGEGTEISRRELLMTAISSLFNLSTQQDLMLGDAILFTERVYSSREDCLRGVEVSKKRRGESDLDRAISDRVSVVSSQSFRRRSTRHTESKYQGKAREEEEEEERKIFIGERVVVGVIVKDSALGSIQRKASRASTRSSFFSPSSLDSILSERELYVEVLWSDVSFSPVFTTFLKRTFPDNPSSASTVSSRMSTTSSRKPTSFRDVQKAWKERKGNVLKRDYSEISHFEVFRAPWEDEEGRTGFEDTMQLIWLSYNDPLAGYREERAEERVEEERREKPKPWLDFTDEMID